MSKFMTGRRLIFGIVLGICGTALMLVSVWQGSDSRGRSANRAQTAPPAIRIGLEPSGNAGVPQVGLQAGQSPPVVAEALADGFEGTSDRQREVLGSPVLDVRPGNYWPKGEPSFDELVRIAYTGKDAASVRQGLLGMLARPDFSVQFRDELSLEIALTYYRQGQLDLALATIRECALRYPEAVHADTSWRWELATHERTLGEEGIRQLEQRIEYVRTHPEKGSDVHLDLAGMWFVKGGRLREAERILREVIDNQGSARHLAADVDWMLRHEGNTTNWAIAPGASGFVPPDPTYLRAEDRATRTLIDVYMRENRTDDVAQLYERLISKWESVAPVPLLHHYARDLMRLGEREQALTVLQRAVQMGECVLVDRRYSPLRGEACRLQLEETRTLLAECSHSK